MNPDTIATVVMVAFVLLAAWVICHTEPGAGERYVHARRYHRAGMARHAVRATTPAPLSVLETVPDTAVSPFAARTA